MLEKIREYVLSVTYTEIQHIQACLQRARVEGWFYPLDYDELEKKVDDLELEIREHA